ILTLDINNELKIKPAKELQKLRKSHLKIENLHIPEGSQYFLGDFPELTLEIIAEFEIKGNEIFGFGFFLDEQYVGEKLEFDSQKSKITIGKENGRLNHQESNKKITFHVFVDRSVIEVFINYHDCITSRVFPKTNTSNGFTIFSKLGSLDLKKIDIWTLETIW
ncbi:MAG: GH32 C-terminal domain-containing protein, partial [Candidatus Lokiarchaeota archaeon]|nr:GH32 C-terminal domain-containing protein [Candidatus Lokiarchaeota archaeon]